MVRMAHLMRTSLQPRQEQVLGAGGPPQRHLTIASEARVVQLLAVRLMARTRQERRTHQT